MLHRWLRHVAATSETCASVQGPHLSPGSDGNPETLVATIQATHHSWSSGVSVDLSAPSSWGPGRGGGGLPPPPSGSHGAGALAPHHLRQGVVAQRGAQGGQVCGRPAERQHADKGGGGLRVGRTAATRGGRRGDLGRLVKRPPQLQTPASSCASRLKKDASLSLLRCYPPPLKYTPEVIVDKSAFCILVFDKECSKVVVNTPSYSGINPEGQWTVHV